MQKSSHPGGKLRELGSESLSDTELLSILISSGIKGKPGEKWDRKWERPMRSLYAHDGIHVDKMIGVYTGKRAYYFEGIDVLPVGIS